MEYLLMSLELKKLENRLEELETLEIKISEEMKQMAVEDSYCVDNPTYQRLRQKLKCEIPMERKCIKEKISNAKIVDNLSSNFDGETVSIGTKVTLDYDGIKETFTIMPVSEGDFEKEIVSCNAPIVKCILGKKKDDIVVFNGFHVKIIAIEEA